MRYLENAIRFVIKYWILALPVLVLTALAYLLTGRNSIDVSNMLNSLSNAGLLKGIPAWAYSSVGTIMPSGGFWLFIFNFIAIPVTYGLINRNLETGSAGLSDIGQVLGQNFVKYVMFFIGSVVLGLGAFIAMLLILFIFGLILGLLGGFGGVILSLITLVIVIAVIVAGVLLSMWFSAMVVDSLDIVAAAKKSIEVVKSSFWTVIGISLLIAIITGIVGAILNLVTIIPLIGPIIASLAPAIKAFVMAVFLLTMYREKTGKTNVA